MNQAQAKISQEKYLTTVVSKSGNVLIADEPLDEGGGDKGFNPFELLAASLASCTAITLRMYADRKNWPLHDAEVSVEVVRESDHTHFIRSIFLHGTLSDDQKKRMLAIANQCPVHKILSHQIAITTSI